MLIRLLSSTFIGSLIKIIISRFRKPTLTKNVIWESDIYHKTTPKNNLSNAIIFGLGAFLVSLPWLYFIIPHADPTPDIIIPKIIASVFLAFGYYTLKGMPLFFRKMYINDSGIEISEFGAPIVSIKSHEIVALIREQQPPNDYDLIYRSGLAINSLSSIDTKFSYPIDLLHKQWQIPTWEVDKLNILEDKTANFTILDKIAAYSLIVFNPLLALATYFIIYGPSSNIFHGLIVLELISVYYSLITFLLNRKRYKRLIEKNLTNSISTRPTNSPS